ncbi:flagellar basal body rod protein FlgF [Sphingomonas naphthae]|uniref:Flagellar basal-body rod protein FlgF n=1 Tax=Sphingomonas naphthae TaxID=1813468 RepID=A0ABY7TL01_9SPHN|nr:flagellar basal body rod protein FlgF [Sphingomonas naphthae]WCT73643.1 flagellar basal body rod protein FlgF [Sphingomonas naphthae]
MDRLIYSSLAAMRGLMAKQATTASNLANVSTTGFRGDMASATATWLRGPGMDGRAAPSEGVIDADMRVGAVAATGRALDVAMEGDAMLGVQAENGEEGYTRRGDLMVSETGLLTTGDGLPVLGGSGPITLPPADKIEIDAGGVIWIQPKGGNANDPLQQVDQLKLVNASGTRIAKSMDGLFRPVAGGTLPSDPDARVNAGALEGSNVNASAALVDMIGASRDWEMQVKMLTTAQDLDKSSADLMRLD